jgi:hypothetical protein
MWKAAFDASKATNVSHSATPNTGTCILAPTETPNNSSMLLMNMWNLGVMLFL